MTQEKQQTTTYEGRGYLYGSASFPGETIYTFPEIVTINGKVPEKMTDCINEAVESLRGKIAYPKAKLSFSSLGCRTAKTSQDENYGAFIVNLPLLLPEISIVSPRNYSELENEGTIKILYGIKREGDKVVAFNLNSVVARDKSLEDLTLQEIEGSNIKYEVRQNSDWGSAEHPNNVNVDLEEVLGNVRNHVKFLANLQAN